MQDIQEAQTINRKKKIGKAAVAFFTVMLALAFLSKTINSISLPRVEYERPSKGSIVKEIRLNGTIEANEVCHYYIPTAMRVLEVNVKTDEKVMKGQCLLKLDTDGIKDRLQDESDRYEQKKINLSMLRLKSDSLRLNPYENAIEEARNQVNRAQSDYERIRALFEAKCETEENLEKALRGLNDAQRTYSKSVADRENAIASNQIETEKNEMEIQSLQYDIEIQKREIDRMKEQLQLNELSASMAGVITDIHFRKGETVDPSQPVYSMIDTSKGCCFIGLLDTVGAKDVKAGDEVEIKPDFPDWKHINGTVVEIRDSREDKGEKMKKEIVIRFSDDTLEVGEECEAKLRQSSKSYNVLVSNSAIGQDNIGYFVYVLQEKKSYFGNELYARIVRVTLGESDDEKTAVLQGITDEDRVITETDKPLADGMRILYVR